MNNKSFDIPLDTRVHLSLSELAEDDIHVNASADNLCRDLARG